MIKSHDILILLVLC